MRRSITLLLSIAVLLAVSGMAFAADGGHVAPPATEVVTAITASVVATTPEATVALQSALSVATVVPATAALTTVDSAVLTSVTSSLTTQFSGTTGKVVTPVVFPQLSASLNLEATDGVGVAFSSPIANLESDLGLAVGETLQSIRNEISVYMYTNSGLVKITESYEIVVVGDNVNVAIKVTSTSSTWLTTVARGAEENYTFQPVLVREAAAEVEDPDEEWYGSGSGGCDAGFASAAMFFALAGCALLNRKTRG
jgi:hypothetical protein